MDRNKKIIVILIFAITTVLAGLSLYVSWQLSQDVAPDDTAAQVEPTPVGDPQPTQVQPTKEIKKKTSPTPSKIEATTPPEPTSVPPTGQPQPTVVVATPIPSLPLPQTAFINDRVDAALFGTLFILSGFILYKRYLNIKTR